MFADAPDVLECASYGTPVWEDFNGSKTSVDACEMQDAGVNESLISFGSMRVGSRNLADFGTINLFDGYFHHCKDYFRSLPMA